MQQVLINNRQPQKAVYLDTKAFVRQESVNENSNDKWYCVREILYEEFLWDMRTWHKPRYEYTREEIKQHIKQWIMDHQKGEWTNNCGHCLYCIHRLLYKRWATWDEVIDLIQKNRFSKYPHSIGTWKGPIED